jgi:hypothetical protein
MLKKRLLGMHLAGIVCAASLAGCATNDQGQLVIDPTKVNAVWLAAVTPPPVLVAAPVVVAPVIEEGYVPAPGDAYIVGVLDSNIVFIGGDTYIWVIGPAGVRRRQFYGHGDRRMEISHRRAQLHVVMAHNNGHLPVHAIAGARPGMSSPRLDAVNRPLPAAHPGMAPVKPLPLAKKPTPTNGKKPASTDEKKPA